MTQASKPANQLNSPINTNNNTLKTATANVNTYSQPFKKIPATLQSVNMSLETASGKVISLDQTMQQAGLSLRDATSNTVRYNSETSKVSDVASRAGQAATLAGTNFRTIG